MAMTITEKILAKHSGKSSVRAGDNVWIDVDVLMTHDVCGPGTFAIFKKEFGKEAKVWNNEKVVVIPDHYVFTSDVHANRNIQILRDFVAEHHLPHFYDVGSPNYKGVCHITLPEEGFTRPGEVLFGTDSHTCTAGAFGEFATGIGNTDAAFVLGTGKLWVKVPETMKFIFEGEMPKYLMAKDLILAVIGKIGVDGASYRAMDFCGETIDAMTMEDRMTICNMVIEAGGKNGICAPDKTTYDYLSTRTTKHFESFYNDDDAKYHSIHRFNVKDIEPTIAKPHSPDNKASVKEVAGTKLDRAYIGSCTGGKISDFLAAAEIMYGEKVKIETFIVPATTDVAKAMKELKVKDKTILQIFEEAGCQIGESSCAACLGGPKDTFGRLNHDEVCISSTNRNFPGRMGTKKSQVYLASPYTVAASAVKGVIASPREFFQ
ncbi:MAG: 3-isopropylmalate dehydratase large subunit [Bacteroidetes bacterium]|nr:3-isopropylmalate dehydratase large subunit [Bacteroidota bacterium]